MVWGEPGGAEPTGPVDLQRLVDLHTESDHNFLELQSKLVKNYFVREAAGDVYWLLS